MRTDTALVLLAAAGDRIIRDTDLWRLGVRTETFQRWVDEGRWVQLAPGRYRSACTEPTFRLQVIAGSEWIGRRGALFGASALAWLGISPSTPLRPEWLVRRTQRWVPSWVTLHTTTRWSNGDVITVDGVRTSTAARALIDFAATRPSARAYESLIETAIAMRLTALPVLRRRLAALSGRGRHGTPLLRELLLDAGGESYLERRFLRLTRQEGFPRPECQVVFRKDGRHIARVDFLFREQATVVEVSGRLGHVSDRDRQRDARRRNALTQSGMAVLEFTTADVIDDPAYVVTTLHTSLHVIS